MVLGIWAVRQPHLSHILIHSSGSNTVLSLRVRTVGLGPGASFGPSSNRRDTADITRHTNTANGPDRLVDCGVFVVDCSIQTTGKHVKPTVEI